MSLTQQKYSYESALATAKKVEWTIEEVIGHGGFDYSKPFLPESLAGVDDLDFLDPAEKRTFNQIRAHAYLAIFGLVEEFILPYVLDHARPQLGENDQRTRALLQFAGEEAKHIELFKRFREEFERSFGSYCEVIGPPEEIARAVLAHDPLGVALVILHIEWFTQRHYVESVRDQPDLDPKFKSLLKHHWLEEAQHAKLDTLMVEALADERSQAEIEKGFEDYLAIGGIIDQGLQQQVEFDIASFEAATGRVFNEEERETLRSTQLRANRWTYLGSGMTHPEVLETVEGLHPRLRSRLEEVAPVFS